MTIPRLELQAAIMGARMRTSILADHTLKPHQTFMWTDSKTVIFWINSEARQYRSFVMHQIAEILANSNENEWRWVPSTLNPADDGTRPSDNPVADSNARWIVGPLFLLNAA